MGNTNEILPRCFFLYCSYRDDAPTIHYNVKSWLKGITEAKTGTVFGYKMYHEKWSSQPCAIETEKQNDYIIGRLITFDDALFDQKLKQMNKLKLPNSTSNPTTVQVTVNVYLQDDHERTHPHRAIMYIIKKPKMDLIPVESNDWMRRNILTSETKITHTNRISLDKSGVTLRSSGSSRMFVEWEPQSDYNKGDIVAIDPPSDILDRIIDVPLWAMCINPHRSTVSNKPQKDEIFGDLLLNITSFITLYLTHHVEGFNTTLSEIIIGYCYKPNMFWWNGCHPKDGKRATCGHLVAGILSTESCKTCIVQQTDNKDKHTASEPIKGAVISLNKTDGTVSRQYVVRSTDVEQPKRGVILRTQIESDAEKQKIYNLLTRNFNKSMKSLIKAGVENNKTFVYSRGTKRVKVYVGDTSVWTLYSVDGEEELLCALVWRYVHAKTNRYVHAEVTKLMFEVLFVSTYEHVRFNHYGQEMVKHMELYCIANGYDLMSVAAVPGHGEAFWQSNGFKDSANTATNHFLRNNMLVFDDTPLYAKHLIDCEK
eukprot:964467_1